MFLKNKKALALSRVEGFTLLELLVVIAIIGILMVALLPTITGAPKKARDTQRKAMVSSIVKSIESYISDNGSAPVDNATLGNGVCLDPATLPGSLLTTYISSGIPAAGPTTTLGNLCTNNGYYYRRLINTTTPGYLVASQVENCTSANLTNANDIIAALKLDTNTTPGAYPTGTTAITDVTKCAYAVVQSM